MGQKMEGANRRTEGWLDATFYFKALLLLMLNKILAIVGFWKSMYSNNVRALGSRVGG